MHLFIRCGNIWHGTDSFPSSAKSLPSRACTFRHTWKRCLSPMLMPKASAMLSPWLSGCRASLMIIFSFHSISSYTGRVANNVGNDYSRKTSSGRHGANKRRLITFWLKLSYKCCMISRQHVAKPSPEWYNCLKLSQSDYALKSVANFFLRFVFMSQWISHDKVIRTSLNRSHKVCWSPPDVARPWSFFFLSNGPEGEEA